MSTYPGGGTPPTSTTTIPPVSSRIIGHTTIQFAFTGADVVGLVLLAIAAVVLGVVFVRRSRR